MPRFLSRIAAIFIFCLCIAGAGFAFAASPQTHAGGESARASSAGSAGGASTDNASAGGSVVAAGAFRPVQLSEEERAARRKNIETQLKSAILSPVAIIPEKKSWPLPEFVEDPAWDNPQIKQAYKDFAHGADFKPLYRPVLLEAVQGNPRAMILLAAAYERWGVDICGAFAVLHPAMHNADYWKRWALQLSSPAWVEMRLGELAADLTNKLSHYRKAAIYRDADAIYQLALLEDDPELLLEAALLWQPEASAQVAFRLAGGVGDFPFSPRQASMFWWRGALGEDAQALMLCSEMFYQGQHGFPKDERQACLFAMFAAEKIQAEEKLSDLPARAGLKHSILRHLEGMHLAMALNEDARWQLRQELEVLKAPAQEARMSRLEAFCPQRETTLALMQDEFFAVRAVLESSSATVTEQQILEKLEQVQAEGDMEQGLRDMLLFDAERQHYNSVFLLLCGGAVLLCMLLYCINRWDLFCFFVRMVSHKNGGKA